MSKETYIEAKKHFANNVSSLGIENYQERLSIIPTDGSDYTFVFMAPQHKELAWLYHDDIPIATELSASLNMCIRMNQGFVSAGLSDRHLKCFEMLHIAGIMPKEEALPLIVKLLQNELSDAIGIWANAHQDDVESINILKQLGLEVIKDEECYFAKSEWTDRTGTRVELKAKRDSGSTSDWELLNIVILSSVGNGVLKTPLIEAGGSYERILSYQDGVTDVHFTSGLEKLERSNDLRNTRAIKDLARLAVVMALNDIRIDVPRTTMKIRQKRVVSVLKELTTSAVVEGLTLGELNTHILDQEQLTNYYSPNSGMPDTCVESGTIIRHYLEYIARRYDNLYSMLERAEKLGLKLNVPENVKRLSDRYDGGSDMLLRYVNRTFV
ncbi:MAG: hypothetical protein WC589_21930 [Sphingobacterium sp.]